MREAAEIEERKTYSEMPEAWQEVLEPLGADAVKSTHRCALACCIVWIIKRIRDNGEFGPTYYSTESCGIMTGMFIHTVHNMGLVTLTHTPSLMGFLRNFGQPEHEHNAGNACWISSRRAMVPDISRKPLEEVSYFSNNHNSVISFLSFETPRSFIALS